MKTKFGFAVLLCCFGLALSSCSGMMKSLEDESDAADGPQPERQARVRPQREETPYHPRTLSGLSANNVNAYDPPVERKYGRAPASAPEEVYGAGAGDMGDGGGNYAQSGLSNTRRVTRDDFVDKDPKENSLWDAQGQGNYLFSNNKHQELGDVISVDVERALKREIQYSLWMNLPPEQRRSRKQPDRMVASTKDGKKAAGDAAADATKGNDGKSELEKNKDAAEEAAKTNMEASKEDDVMRMEVVESLSGGMVRLMGQKRVIYRGVSRVVEIVALANSRDVDESGKIKSSAFMDTKTQVIQ